MNASSQLAPLDRFEALVGEEVEKAKRGDYTIREAMDGLSKDAQRHLDVMAKAVSLVYGMSLGLARAVILGALLRQDMEATGALL